MLAGLESHRSRPEPGHRPDNEKRDPGPHGEEARLNMQARYSSSGSVPVFAQLDAETNAGELEMTGGDGLLRPAPAHVGAAAGRSVAYLRFDVAHQAL